MVCKVKMGSYPNFTNGVQWTISGNGDHGMEHNDAVESWEITGCENSSVVFYEHGDHNRRQQAHVLTNGKYQRYNESKWINSHGPYASPLNGISAAKIQSPGGESLVNGGKINAIIDIPDGQGPHAQESSTVDNWDNYLKPNQDHNLSNHCPGATWKAWQHAKTADKPSKALCQWKITENNMASLASSNETHVKGKYNTIINRVCNAIKNDTPNFKTGRANNETCWDLVSTQDFMKDYCFKADDKKSNDPLCSKSSLGDSYEILATEYCAANPDDPFCGCYNVVTNKCKSEEIDKEIKRLEDARKPIEGVRYVWFGFDDKIEYLNIAQIEVYSGGVNIVKDIDDSKVTVGSTYETSDNKYVSDHLFDGNYDTIYHSGLEAGWKTTSNKRYNLQNLKGQYVSLGSGADVSYNAELGDDEDASVADCKKVCASLPKCKSTLYDKRGKSCHMLSATTADTSTLSNTNNDIIEKIGDSQHNYVKIDLGKDYTIDSVKIFNRKSCGSKEANNICNDRWAGSFVKLLRSNGSLIKASEKVVGDYKQGGERVISFFDNGVGAANAKSLIPGCKITVPIRRTLNNLPPSIPQAALDGADKCWGNVCGPLNEIGGDNFVPENTIVAGGICSKSMTICNVDLRADILQDSEINIEQK